MTAGIKRIVIVGGGIAGVSTAAALRAGGFDGDLTLVDGGEFPYDRPPLSKEYLAGKTELKDAVLQSAQWYADHRVRLLTATNVAALRTDLGAVELVDGTTIAADKVVLATGGTAIRPPISGSDSDRIHVLRTADDADRLRAALTPGARLLIVGAGLIGAEVASTATGLGCEVTIVDPITAPLAGAFGSEIATWLHDLHAVWGVTTVEGVVESFHGTADGIATTMNGAQRRFDAVVLAVGMAADTTLAYAAGLRVDRGIVVDHEQMSSNPAVLAVGDAAQPCDKAAVFQRSEHWEAAQRDGQRAAATILGGSAPPDTAPWFWTDRYGLHVEVVGSLHDAEQFVRRGQLSEAPFSLFGLTGAKIVGAIGVNDSTAVRAARRLIDRGVTVDTRDLGDVATDLRKLVNR